MNRFFNWYMVTVLVIGFCIGVFTVTIMDSPKEEDPIVKEALEWIGEPKIRVIENPISFDLGPTPLKKAYQEILDLGNFRIKEVTREYGKNNINYENYICTLRVILKECEESIHLVKMFEKPIEAKIME